MSNFETAVEATEASVGSYGATMRQNDVYMESMEAKLQGLKTEFETLVLGKGGLQNFAKTLIDLGTKILKFANSDIGQAIIKITLLSTAFNLLAKSLQLMATNAIPALIAWFTRLGFAIEASAEAGAGLSFILNKMGINPVVLGITALVAVLYGLVKVIEKVNPSYEKLKENLAESSEKVANTTSEIESLTEQLKELKEQIDELNSTSDITEKQERELSMYRAQSAEIENQIALLKEKQRLEIQENQENFEKYMEKKVINPYRQGDDDEITKKSKSGSLGGSYHVDSKYTTATNTDTVTLLKDATAEMKNTEVEIERLYNKKQSYIGLTEEEQKQYDEVISRYNTASQYVTQYGEDLVTATENVDENSDSYKRAKEAIDDASSALKDRSETVKEALNIDDDFIDDVEEEIEITEDFLKAIGMSERQLEKYAESLNLGIEKVAEFINTLKTLNSDIDDLQSAYDILNSVQQEYAESGKLSIDTVQSLLELSPEYLSCLSNENGQLVVSTDLLNQKIEAEMAEAEQVIYGIGVKELNALIEQKVGDARAEATTKIDEETTALEKNTEAEYLNAVAKAYQAGVSADDINSVTDSIEAMKSALADATFETNKNSRATGGASSSNKKMKASIELVTEAIDKHIDALKKEKDTAIKAVEAQIKALEKEKDAKVKAIETEIKSLEKQKEAREKYWQEQLDKLEKENNERERNIELQEKQQALALAQQTQVSVFKDGQFQYMSDESAVADATQSLQETEDKNTYERQKELIEELRDTELEWYEDRIEALEEYKEQVEEYYEEQIEQLEEYKDYLEAYYDEQIEKLEETKERVSETFQNMSADLQAHYAQMLADASDFVTAFNAILEDMGMGGGGERGGTPSNLKSTGDNNVGLSHYAKGKASVPDNQLAIVGENPKYKEIVIGSKLNRDAGTLLSLKRGSGVVNAGATNTLASLFNSLSSIKPNGTLKNQTQGGTQITIGSISLPEVKDGKGFVDYLQNFSADITQMAYSH